MKATWVIGALLIPFVGGCAMRSPVVADVRCPRGTQLLTAGGAGHCQLPDGSKHGPSFAVTANEVTVDGYDHGVLAGPWARYEKGRLVKHGYRPGVTTSNETDDDPGLKEWLYDSPTTTGKLVVPSRVRLFPVQGDVAFSANTLISAQGRPTSSFLGVSADVALSSAARLRFRGAAYRAYYVAYGIEGAVGSITRADCDDPTIAGSGGFCGSRWLLGPAVRVGYATSTDAHPHASVPSLLAYGKVGFLLGQDRWHSVYSSGDALVWRVRVGAGYTALGSLIGLARSPSDGWKWVIVPLLALFEHAEAHFELGGDNGSTVGVGAGVDVGFGF